MVRAFLAIDLPQELKKELYSLSKIDIPEGIKLKWVEEENLHLTLRFFGNVSENLVENIYKKCKSVCEEILPFELELDTAGYFPFQGIPRVVWIGIKDFSNNIFKLYDSLKKALKPLKLKNRDEEFHPHITLLRIKERADEKTLRKFIEELKSSALKFKGKKFYVKEIVLYKSELHPSGPKYTPLKYLPLGVKNV